MSSMPGENTAQYRRNSRRERASVVLTRVSVRNPEMEGPSGMASSVQAILAYPGSSNATNSSGARPRNLTSACHGWVTAPTTTARSGSSASTRHPRASVSERREAGARGGAPRSRAGSVRMAKMSRTSGDR